VSDKARLRAMVDAEGSFARDYTLVIANDKYVAEGRWGALPNFLTLSERGFAPVLVYKRSSRTDAIETELIADPMVHGSVLSKMRSAESLVVLNLSKALRRSLSALLRIREGHI
jgi:hypothetical protein